MFCRVLNTPMNTAAKYLLRDYWWELETKEIKWCIGSKRVMPSLCIHILFALFHLFDFSFSTLHFIIHSIRTATVKNKCCVFLVSTLNGFCFIGNAVSVSSNSYQLRHISNPVNYWWWSFLKKLAMFFSCWLFCHKSYRTDVCQALKFASNPNTVTFSTQNSLSKLFLLIITIKRKIWVMKSYFW